MSGGLDDTAAAETRTGARGSAQASGARGLSRGDAIGRYVILAKLGAGGMGVVYAAYDPELDRKVALKLLLPELARVGSDGPARLLREAQALARLSHPNVVAIHDVGAREEDVWLAMEFVDGESLDAWLARARRSWREVLDMLRPAAEGLAAAHQASLVHRDVKPHNVMCGRDGRVRVMDFGLARGVAPATERAHAGSLEPDAEAKPTQGRLGSALTEHGATPGTPAYMAPEQIAGETPDERSDQFSFCVMLWEALYGARPFQGRTLEELTTAIVEVRLHTPPTEVRVPRWLRAAMMRGLARNPSERWPSMKALLLALERGRTRARFARTAAVLAIVGVGAAAALGLPYLERKRLTEVCEREGAAIDSYWNDEQREGVRASLLRTGAGHAALTADKLMPWLDEYAAAWRDARTQSCEDAHVSKRWDAELLERANWCLDDRRLRLAALVDELKNATLETSVSAVTSAAGLPSIDACRNEVLLGAVPTLPREDLDTIQAVRGELARADALRQLGAHDEGLAAGVVALEHARQVGWLAITAEAERLVGDLQEDIAAYDTAEATLESAFFDAWEAGALEVALDASDALLYAVGYRQGRHADGERWLRHSQALRSMLPDPGRLREARGHRYLGMLRERQGRYREAIDLHEQALSILLESLPPNSPKIGDELHSLGVAQLRADDLDAARESIERAVVLREAALGPDHPQVADALGSLANVFAQQGKFADAAPLHARAAETVRAALGAEHPTVANHLNNLANALEDLGKWEEAGVQYTRALEIRERALGPEHPDVADSLNNLASHFHGLGSYDKASELFTRAVAIQEKVLRADHPALSRTIGNLGRVRRSQGRFAEAVELLSRALEMDERVFGTEHRQYAMNLGDLAGVYYESADYERAVALYRQTLEIEERVLGAEHPSLYYTLCGLGASVLEQGSIDEARAAFTRALALVESSLGRESDNAMEPLRGLALVELRANQPAAAIPLAERIVAIAEASAGHPRYLAEGKYVLARAVFESGGSTSRARTLCEEARERLLQGEGDSSALLRDIDELHAKL